MKLNNLGKTTFIGFVYAFLYLPLIVLVIYSVNSAKFSLQWQGFSSRWYVELLQDRGLWTAFWHSLELGLSAAFFATVFGLLACVHLFLHQPFHQRRLQTLLFLLIIIPDLVLGVGLLLFFNFMHIPLGFFSLFIAHTSFCLPFAMLTINNRLSTLDANLYLSAVDLGASRSKALMRILLPLLWPAILSAFLLSFTLSFDDVIISYFVAGPDFNILPLSIYSLVRAGVTPELNALCTITILLSMILVLFSYRLSGKSL